MRNCWHYLKCQSCTKVRSLINSQYIVHIAQNIVPLAKMLSTMARYGTLKGLTITWRNLHSGTRCCGNRLVFRKANWPSGLGCLGSLKRFESTGQISLESLLKLAELLHRLPDFEILLKPVENLESIEKLFSDKMRG